MMHRDLKPENFLIEMDPLFKVIIADSDTAKIATDTALLWTFCGSLRYTAPEVFPGLSSGYGPQWTSGLWGDRARSSNTPSYRFDSPVKTKILYNHHRMSTTLG